MGIVEDRNTKQSVFCYLCFGPAPHKTSAGNPVCYEHFQMFQSFSNQIKPRKRNRTYTGSKSGYAVKRKVFLAENPICWVGLLVFKTFELANTVHHRAGRTNGNFLKTSTWLPTTRHGDKWIHSNVEHAKELGLLI